MSSRNVLIGLTIASLTGGVVIGMTTPTTMQKAPEAPWRSTWRTINAASPGYPMIEAGPADLSPDIPVAAMRVAAWDAKQAVLPAPALPASHKDDIAIGVDVNGEPASSTGKAGDGRIAVAAAGRDPYSADGPRVEEPLALVEPGLVVSGDSYAR